VALAANLAEPQRDTDDMCPLECACPFPAHSFVVVVPYDHGGSVMKYVLMICIDEDHAGSLSPEDGAAILAEYGAFAEEMGARGVLQGGERLRPSADATTVKVRGGEVLVSDGPFAETKEQIGGYFLVDCKDLDEAIEIAAKVPGARVGSIEVRPIWPM
jgi:hypothetical protein